MNRVEELVEWIEFTKGLINKKIENLKIMIEKNVVTDSRLQADTEELFTLFDKYSQILVRLKKEFNIADTKDTEELSALIWDIRVMDDEERGLIKQIIKIIRKQGVLIVEDAIKGLLENDV